MHPNGACSVVLGKPLRGNFCLPLGNVQFGRSATAQTRLVANPSGCCMQQGHQYVCLAIGKADHCRW